MHVAPFDRVHVASEVEELQAVVLHAPGDAHWNILPEHIEHVIELGDYLRRRHGFHSDDLRALTLGVNGDKKLELSPNDVLTLDYETHDGVSGQVELGGVMKKLFVENPQYILFDDLVDGGRARQEHDTFKSVVEAVAPHTLSFGALLHDALHQLHRDDALREEFFRRLSTCALPEERENVDRSRRYFREQGARRFLRLLLTGRDHFGNYVFHPLPNLLFTRDLAAAVGDTLVVNMAAKKTRQREMVLSWLVFAHHPIFRELQDKGEMKLIDMTEVALNHEGPGVISVEGGDILHLGGGTLLIGLGERTSAEGAIALARRLWEGGNTTVQRVILVQILDQRAAMHLDTIFTLAYQSGDSFEAMVYAPFVHKGGYGEISAYSLRPEQLRGPEDPTLGDLQCWRRRSLGELLAEIQGWQMTPFFCGGRMRLGSEDASDNWSDPESVFLGELPNERRAKREQWTDGANLFALAPGIVLTYARNCRSLEEMASHGYQVVEPDRFIANNLYYLKRCRGPQRLKVAIPIPGSELSRGRGGHRCMTLPLLRERTERTGV